MKIHPELIGIFLFVKTQVIFFFMKLEKNPAFYRPARAKERREWRLKIENKCLKTLMKVISKEFKLKEVQKNQRKFASSD